LIISAFCIFSFVFVLKNKYFGTKINLLNKGGRAAPAHPYLMIRFAAAGREAYHQEFFVPM
jgi:hypothetical protein